MPIPSDAAAARAPLRHLPLVPALGLLAALAAVVSLWWPYDWDQGAMAWVGDTIVNGGMPYRDAWDVKGPLTYYVFALVQWATGRGMWGLRVFELLLLLPAAAAIGLAVARHTDRRAGRITALLFVLNHLSLGYAQTGQPDAWVGLLLAITAAPLLGSGTSRARAAACGFAVGLCMLLKPHYGMFLALPALYLLLDASRPVGERLRSLLLPVAAMLVPIVACALWFAHRGALTPLVDTYILLNLEQSGYERASPGELVGRAFDSIVPQPGVLLLLAAAMAALHSLARDQRRTALVLGAWLGAALLGLVLQGRFWPYHWHVVYPPLFLGAGIAAGRWWRDGAAASRVRRAAVALFAAVIALAAVWRPLLEIRKWGQYVSDGISADTYYRHFRNGPGSPSIVADRELADWLRQATAPGEPVLVWTNPLVNHLSDRPSVGRLAFHIPINVTSSPAHRDAFRAELLADLAVGAPRLLVVTRGTLARDDGRSRANIGVRFPAFARLIAERYRLVHAIERYDIYHRVDAAQAAAVSP